MVLAYGVSGVIGAIILAVLYAMDVKNKRAEIERHMLMDLISADVRPVRRMYKKLRRGGMKPEKAMKYAFKSLGIEYK